MPIRMTDDPVDPNQQDDSGGGGRRGPNFPGGGGGLGALLPMLLGLFRGKGGKGGIIILLVLAAGAYFLFFKGGGCNIGDVASKLTTGGLLDPKQFEKAKIYEPTVDDPSREPLPEAANLQKFAPSVGNQGEQGSCVAWSSAYAARSILESSRTGNTGENVKFSPSFLYNQIGLDGCQGSYIIKAMEFMTQQGSVPYGDFAYDDQDCSRQPDPQLMSEARQFKMHGFNRLSDGDRTDAIDLYAIKQNLAQGAPVVIGMMVGQSFMQSMKGEDLWQPEDGDENMMGFGGHAMCVVGYDDNKYGGSFLLMNSWGPEWGNNGFAWVRYNDFKTFVREAYGVDPMHNTEGTFNNLACYLSLVRVEYKDNKTVIGNYILLDRSGTGNSYRTTSPLPIGSTFKVQVKNNTECYIYVFGKETDGTSYTLFPYPTKEDPTKTRYSPFCGITGYRLFPKDKSMTPDSIGTRDVIAIVLSKEELDWYSLNQQISKNPQADFGQRVRAALGNKLSTANSIGKLEGAEGAQLFTKSPNESMIACIIEIDKQ